MAKSTQAKQVDVSTLVAAIQSLTQNIGISARRLTNLASSVPILGAGFGPGGRLATSASTPLPTSVEAATVLYYLPYIHNKIPIYNGTTWQMFQIPSGGLSNTITDATVNPSAMTNDQVAVLLVWNNNGTLQLTRMAAQASTATSFSNVQLQNGLLVNSVAVTNGPPALQGTVVGTVGTWTAGNGIYYVRGSSPVANDVLVGLRNQYNQLPYPIAMLQPTNSQATTANVWVGIPFHYHAVRAVNVAHQDVISWHIHVNSGVTTPNTASIYLGLGTVASATPRLYRNHMGGGNPVSADIEDGFTCLIDPTQIGELQARRSILIFPTAATTFGWVGTTGDDAPQISGVVNW